MLLNLTGIRGLAAVWVVLYHFQGYLKDVFGQRSWISPIIDCGHFGVDLFFCLSGFIIGYVYFESFVSNPKNKIADLKDFFLKRFARLYPVYVVTTLIALFMFFFARVIGHTFGQLSDEALTISNVVKNLFAIQILDNSTSLNYPSWSVSAEFFAYLIFPLLVYGLFINPQSTRFVAGILFLLSLLIYEGSVFFDFFANDPISKVVTEFVMGMTCYLWIRKMSFRREFVVLMRFFSTFILICFLLFVENGVVLSALMPLLLLGIIALNYFHNIPDRGLGRKALVKLGLWSYSLYLTHGLFHYFLGGVGLPIRTDEILINILQLCAIILTALLIAKLTTELVEIPCRRYLLKKFS